MVEFFKTQRLHPDEIKEWDYLRASGQPLGDTFAQKLRQAFAEGILRDDLKTVDEEAFIGTCGQLIFKWIRTEYYGSEVICALPASHKHKWYSSRPDNGAASDNPRSGELLPG